LPNAQPVDPDLRVAVDHHLEGHGGAGGIEATGVLRDPADPARFVLPDYLQRTYRTFPLDLEMFNGDASWTLPMPGRFVIDRQGIIRSAEFDPDYTTRPEPADTLEALRRLPR